MVAINYIIRALVIAVGIVLVSGVLTPPGGDNTMFTIMGIVVILFGIYRILTYYSGLKRYNFELKRSENEENDLH